MKIAIIMKFLGLITGVITAWMAWPLMVSLAHEAGDWTAIAKSMCVGSAAAFVLYVCGRSGEAHDMGLREAFTSVTLSWVVASAVSALPYWFYGTLTSYVDCYFEAMSGLTTTGATVITDVEVLPHGILLWRALTHWLGGMGIIVLTLTIMPLLGIGSFHLYSAETPGMIHEKLTPRMQQTAIILWGIYVGITIAEIVLLMFGGMSIFEAITHSFATVATGGFSTRNSSIAAFDSAYIDGVITVFMFICGMNFTLIHAAIAHRSVMKFFRDPEFRFYLTIVLGASVAIAIYLRLGNVYDSTAQAFRYSVFQVVSLITTTGFVTANYEQWPYVTQAIAFILLFFGPCAGSTGGAIKHIRILVLYRHASRQFSRILNPRSVLPIKVGNVAMEATVASSCLAFFAAYIGLFVIGTLIIANMGVDNPLTAMSAIVTSMSNVGPGFGEVGPVNNFASQPAAVKCVCSFMMLCGRLEVYTVLMLFSPTFWRGGVDTVGARRGVRFSRVSDSTENSRRS